MHGRRIGNAFEERTSSLYKTNKKLPLSILLVNLNGEISIFILSEVRGEENQQGVLERLLQMYMMHK
jgi:hypothetical protein